MVRAGLKSVVASLVSSMTSVAMPWVSLKIIELLHAQRKPIMNIATSIFGISICNLLEANFFIYFVFFLTLLLSFKAFLVVLFTQDRDFLVPYPTLQKEVYNEKNQDTALFYKKLINRQCFLYLCN